ncbi:hypothetical protein D0Y65_017363 [Glycine soja]|uniref:Uncharacterized protein n=1 Tax=Glycine soja TaxID=3848 RepID=A0A445JUM5_GLYSO|nr:hypothetical protein D0Y65_017363 [Glycine soja]
MTVPLPPATTPPPSPPPATTPPPPPPPATTTPLPPLPSMSLAPPCPTPVPPVTAPLPTPRLMPVAGLPDLCHTRAIVSYNNLFGIVASCSRAATSNGKVLERKNMSIFTIGTESHGPTMVACKCQPAAAPKESRRNKPWDPGITFGSNALKPQHLEDKALVPRKPDRVTLTSIVRSNVSNG